MKQRRLKLAMVPLLGVVLAAAGCGNSDGILGVDQGRVRFVLTAGTDAAIVADQGSATASTSGLIEDGDGNHPDRYHPFFQSANVTFTSILARNLDGILVDVSMELPVSQRQ